MSIEILFPIDQDIKVTPELAVDAMSEGLERLVKNGAIKGPVDEVLLTYRFQEDTGYCIAELKEGSLQDGARLNQVGAGLNLLQAPSYTLDQATKAESKTFSIQTIQDRMRMQRFQPKIRFRYLVLDYKRFWKAKGKSLKDPKKIAYLRNMFISDFNNLMTEILPYIEEGKQLATLVGTNQVSPTLSKVSRELSLIYRRALKANASTGQIPKGIFQRLQKSYLEFISTLIPTVFPGMGEMLGTNAEGQESKDETDKSVITEVTKNTSKTYSYTEEGRIKLFD